MIDKKFFEKYLYSLKNKNMVLFFYIVYFFIFSKTSSFKKNSKESEIESGCKDVKYKLNIDKNLSCGVKEENNSAKCSNFDEKIKKIRNKPEDKTFFFKINNFISIIYDLIKCSRFFLNTKKKMKTNNSKTFFEILDNEHVQKEFLNFSSKYNNGANIMNLELNCYKFIKKKDKSGVKRFIPIKTENKYLIISKKTKEKDCTKSYKCKFEKFSNDTDLFVPKFNSKNDDITLSCENINFEISPKNINNRNINKKVNKIKFLNRKQNYARNLCKVYFSIFKNLYYAKFLNKRKYILARSINRFFSYIKKRTILKKIHISKVQKKKFYIGNISYSNKMSIFKMLENLFVQKYYKKETEFKHLPTIENKNDSYKQYSTYNKAEIAKVQPKLTQFDFFKDPKYEIQKQIIDNVLINTKKDCTKTSKMLEKINSKIECYKKARYYSIIDFSLNDKFHSEYLNGMFCKVFYLIDFFITIKNIPESKNLYLFKQKCMSIEMKNIFGNYERKVYNSVINLCETNNVYNLIKIYLCTEKDILIKISNTFGGNDLKETDFFEMICDLNEFYKLYRKYKCKKTKNHIYNTEIFNTFHKIYFNERKDLKKHDNVETTIEKKKSLYENRSFLRVVNLENGIKINQKKNSLIDKNILFEDQHSTKPNNFILTPKNLNNISLTNNNIKPFEFLKNNAKDYENKNFIFKFRNFLSFKKNYYNWDKDIVIMVAYSCQLSYFKGITFQNKIQINIYSLDNNIEDIEYIIESCEENKESVILNNSGKKAIFVWKDSENRLSLANNVKKSSSFTEKMFFSHIHDSQSCFDRISFRIINEKQYQKESFLNEKQDFGPKNSDKYAYKWDYEIKTLEIIQINRTIDNFIEEDSCLNSIEKFLFDKKQKVKEEILNTNINSIIHIFPNNKKKSRFTSKNNTSIDTNNNFNKACFAEFKEMIILVIEGNKSSINNACNEKNVDVKTIQNKCEENKITEICGLTSNDIDVDAETKSNSFYNYDVEIGTEDVKKICTSLKNQVCRTQRCQIADERNFLQIFKYHNQNERISDFSNIRRDNTNMEGKLYMAIHMPIKENPRFKQELSNYINGLISNRVLMEYHTNQTVFFSNHENKETVTDEDLSDLQSSDSKTILPIKSECLQNFNSTLFLEKCPIWRIQENNKNVKEIKSTKKKILLKVKDTTKALKNKIFKSNDKKTEIKKNKKRK